MVDSASSVIGAGKLTQFIKKNSNIMKLLSEIIDAVINSRHGWAVAQQFTDTFVNEEPFEEQNYNALVYIEKELDRLIYADYFDADNSEVRELVVYYENLREYLSIKN